MAGRKQFDVDEALRGAMLVFWRWGYSEASIERLTEGTGLGRGSLYGTFGDKSALFRKSLIRYAETYHPQYHQALSGPHPDPGAVVAVPLTPNYVQGSPADPATLAPYRKGVARECLGKEDPAPERTPRPPVAVAPVASPRPAIPPAPAALPPPVQIPPLRTVTQCDPSGCWTSDGIRLNRMGPILVGPLGACTVQSRVLSCR